MSTPQTQIHPEGRTPAQHAVAEHLRLLFEAADIDAWVELFAPDGIFTFPFAPAGMVTELQGRDALLAQMRSFPEMFDARVVDFKFLETTDPLLAVAQFGLTGQARPTGKPYEQRVICVVRTDADGFITRFDDYWNPLVAMEALQADEVEDPGTSGLAGSSNS